MDDTTVELHAHTAVHQPGCDCGSCANQSSVPADQLDDTTLAAALIARADDHSVRSDVRPDSHPRFPHARITVDGTWGDGADRTATVTWNSGARRNVTIGDRRSIIDATWDPAQTRRVNRRVIAGRYELVERDTGRYADQSITIPLAELNQIADGLVDAVIDVTSDTESDYGYGGELYDHGVATIVVTGWQLRDDHEQPGPTPARTDRRAVAHRS